MLFLVFSGLVLQPRVSSAKYTFMSAFILAIVIDTADECPGPKHSLVTQRMFH